MKSTVELSRHTWIAAIRLAVVISIVAVFAAVVVSTLGNVPQAAIVLPVIVVAFTASWIQTNRVRSTPAPVRIRTTAPR
jgi:ABC-type enterochelin transport system permease subunit